MVDQASRDYLGSVEDAVVYWMYLDDKDEHPANSVEVFTTQDAEPIGASRIRFRLRSQESSEEFELLVFRDNGEVCIKFTGWAHPEPTLSAHVFHATSEAILRVKVKDRGEQLVFVHLAW